MVALESELAKTSQSKVEKKMVQRYRGVKFFGATDAPDLWRRGTATDKAMPTERQKLLRKIKQAKKQLADVPESADAQRALFDARADLYYVLVRSLPPCVGLAAVRTLICLVPAALPQDGEVHRPVP